MENSNLIQETKIQSVSITAIFLYEILSLEWILLNEKRIEKELKGRYLNRIV